MGLKERVGEISIKRGWWFGTAHTLQKNKRKKKKMFNFMTKPTHTHHPFGHSLRNKRRRGGEGEDCSSTLSSVEALQVGWLKLLERIRHYYLSYTFGLLFWCLTIPNQWFNMNTSITGLDCPLKPCLDSLSRA